MARALARHRAQEAIVLPIIVRDVDWSLAAFSTLQVLPRDGKPVTLWSDRDSAWKHVAEGIRKVLEEQIGKLRRTTSLG